jgi:hypothetical protein
MGQEKWLAKTYLRKWHTEEEVLLIVGVVHTGVRAVLDRSCRWCRILTAPLGVMVLSTPERIGADGRSQEQPGSDISNR